MVPQEGLGDPTQQGSKRKREEPACRTRFPSKGTAVTDRTDPMKRTTKKEPRTPVREADLVPVAAAPEAALVEGRPPRSRAWEDESLPEAHAAPALVEDDEEDEDEEEEAVVEEVAADDESAPDDALGLYLRQMGAIPLLNREQELALAKRLEHQRRRYRRAALANWRSLDLVVRNLRSRSGRSTGARSRPSTWSPRRGLSRQKILERMPYNLRTLTPVLDRATDAFGKLLRAGTTGRWAGSPRVLARVCARASSWPRRCRRASTCSTAGPTSCACSPTI